MVANQHTTRRLKSCVEQWLEAETGEYNPKCCRFPKSCSADIYDSKFVGEEDLEPEAGEAPDA